MGCPRRVKGGDGKSYPSCREVREEELEAIINAWLANPTRSIRQTAKALGVHYRQAAKARNMLIADGWNPLDPSTW